MNKKNKKDIHKNKRAANAATQPTVRILTPEEIVRHCEAKIVPVPVPEWGPGICVPCKIPTPEKMLEMRMANPSKEAYTDALFAAALQGFTAEQLEALKAGNGLKYSQLFSAVMTASDLFSSALTEESLGEPKPS